MVDTASIFMRALTSFLNPTVTLDLGQSIITHFSFKWKISRLVISSIMYCSHLKDLSIVCCSWDTDEEKCLWIFLFYKQYIGCNCMFVTGIDEWRLRAFKTCLERYDATYSGLDLLYHYICKCHACSCYKWLLKLLIRSKIAFIGM